MSRLALGSELMVAKPLEGRRGYTWTLPSLLGDMLQIAQAMFGERDTSYTILGVEYGSGDRPRVWCPGNRKDLIVQLSARCIDEPLRACYQLAHESIHLLGPMGCAGANVLEEGLATYFAQYYMKTRLGARWHSSLASYTSAQRYYEALHGLDADAVKTLRREQPTIGLFTVDLLLRHYPALGEATAQALTARFVRGDSAPEPASPAPAPQD